MIAGLARLSLPGCLKTALCHFRVLRQLPEVQGVDSAVDQWGRRRRRKKTPPTDSMWLSLALVISIHEKLPERNKAEFNRSQFHHQIISLSTFNRPEVSTLSNLLTLSYTIRTNFMVLALSSSCATELYFTPFIYKPLQWKVYIMDTLRIFLFHVFIFYSIAFFIVSSASFSCCCNNWVPRWLD